MRALRHYFPQHAFFLCFTTLITVFIVLFGATLFSTEIVIQPYLQNATPSSIYIMWIFAYRKFILSDKKIDSIFKMLAADD